jgi:hypothetical protein
MSRLLLLDVEHCTKLGAARNLTDIMRLISGYCLNKLNKVPGDCLQENMEKLDNEDGDFVLT